MAWDFIYSVTNNIIMVSIYPKFGTLLKMMMIDVLWPLLYTHMVG